MTDKAQEPAAPDTITRRGLFSYLSWMGLGWACFTSSVLAAGAATFRFFFPNVLFEPRPEICIGAAEEYAAVGKVYTQWSGERIILVRTAEGIYALSTECTHLGCMVSWFDGEEKFRCPCHGSGFYRNGINFEGPAPRPLERYRITQGRDGRIVVDKSKRFRQERGEWEEPEAFLYI